MFFLKKYILAFSCCVGISTFAYATNSLLPMLMLDENVISLKPGQTVEIPLHSDAAPSGDLAAHGYFQNGDVTFTDGPGCHLAAHECTLIITASRTSQEYSMVPVTISESAVSNTPVMWVSVIHPAGWAPESMRVPNVLPRSLPIIKRTQAPVVKPISIQRSGNTLFYATTELHPSLQATANGMVSDFTANTNGPSYQIISLTNNDVTQPLSVELSGVGAKQVRLDSAVADYGNHDNCATLTTIAHGNSCLLIMKGEVGDPSKPPQTTIITLHGEGNNIAKFKMINTSYVYVGGGFNTLGGASVSGGDLLAECTAGACYNALQGTTGNNYASASTSPGNWINTIAVTSNGHLEVAGVFGAMGGATSGTTDTSAALLAQCTPGAITGNACVNQINASGSLTNAYAFNNAYINALTLPVNTSGTTYFMFLGGDFNQIRGFTAAASGKMSAKCQYATTGSGQSATCNFTTDQYFDKAIAAINYDGTNLEFGGLFANYYYSSTLTPPVLISRLAQCIRFGATNAGNCTAIVTSGPNNSVLGITNNGATLYIGGAFKSIGGYTDNSGYPLVTCTGTSPNQTCSNALSGTNDANGYIEGLAYSGSLYVGGAFTTIGGTTPVSGGYMLATCTPGGACSNFIMGTNPYASGSDFGGFIGAIAIGTQTSITAE